MPRGRPTAHRRPPPPTAAFARYAQPTNANLGSTCTHLTNYSINKDSEAFVQVCSPP